MHSPWDRTNGPGKHSDEAAPRRAISRGTTGTDKLGPARRSSVAIDNFYFDATEGVCCDLGSIQMDLIAHFADLKSPLVRFGAESSF